MINWPHIGLYGEFASCEEGLVSALNRNFFIIDSLLQLKVIDFVETLPSSPEEGDIYIVEDSSYTYTSGNSYIMMFNGGNWIQIIPKAGFIAWVESEENFFYNNGSDWIILPKTIGDVSGPNSSLENSIARFDGLTGKFIKSSGVIIDDLNNISGASKLTANEIDTLLLTVSSAEITPLASSLDSPTVVHNILKGSILTLDSVGKPTLVNKSRVHIIENGTDHAVEIKNNATIRTGTGEDLSLASGASIFLIYSSISDQWIIVGGSGAGSGVIVVPDIASRNAIAQNKRTNGMLVQVISEDTIYKLIGLPLGATTTDANWDAVITSKASQVITAKDIDGGTATNTSRQTLPKDQMSGLLNLNRKEGTLTYDTQSKQPLYDDGTSLAPMGPEVVNFIKNGKADFNDLGWNRYVNAAGAVPVNGTGGDPLDSSMGLTITTDSFVLSGHKCFELNKYAGNAQGKGFSYDFTIDRASLASMLTVTFDYEVSFGTFNAGSDTTNSDLMIYLYDITNNKIIHPQGGSKLYSQKDQYRAWFQSAPDSYNYRLILHCATTNAAVWSMTLDNFSVSRTNYAIGTIITDWQSYTPLVGSVSGTPTNYTTTGKWMQIGPNILCQYRVDFIGAVGSWSRLNVSLPTGKKIDTSDLVVANRLPESRVKLISSSTFELSTGWTALVSGESAVTIDACAVQTHTGTAPIVEVAFTNAFPAALSSGHYIEGSFTAPIQGWSSGAQLSDGYDGRVVAASLNAIPTGTIATTFAASTSLVFPSAFMDTVAGYNSTNGEYVIKTAGQFNINGSIGLTIGTTAGTNYVDIALFVNGSQRRVINNAVTIGAGSFNFGFPFTFKENLNYNDVITIRVQSNASTKTLILSSLGIEKLSGSAFMSPTASVVVSAYNISGQSIPSGSFTNMTGWTKSSDTHSLLNASTGVITTAEAGFYEAHLEINVNNLNINNAAAIALTPSVGVGKESTGFCAATGSWIPLSVSWIGYLPSGATLTPKYLQDSGTPKTLSTGITRNSLTFKKIK